MSGDVDVRHAKVPEAKVERRERRIRRDVDAGAVTVSRARATSPPRRRDGSEAEGESGEEVDAVLADGNEERGG